MQKTASLSYSPLFYSTVTLESTEGGVIMLTGQRQNIHRSKIPKLGAIGRIIGLSTVNPRRKCIVIAYPLCDNVQPYSIGIHTCWVRFLHNGDILRFSGIWFQEA